MKKIVYAFALLSALPLATRAQRAIGVATSNWNGTTGLYLNPSSIADSRNKFAIELFGINGFADNDMGTLNSNNLFSRTNNRDVLTIKDFSSFTGKGTGNLIAPYGEVRGPGFMWNIDHKNAIALTTRLRGFNQFSDVNQAVYRSTIDPAYGASNGNYSVNARDFNWNAASWSEIGLSYARVLVDDGRDYFSLGFTARYIGGIAYLSMDGRNIDATYYAANDSIQINNTNVTYTSNVPSSSAVNENTSNSELFSRFFGAKGGRGFGADFGFTYEYRPDYKNYQYDMDGQTNLWDYSRPRYKFRLSAALTDIGSMTFNTPENHKVNLTGNGSFSGRDFAANANNYGNFRNFMQSRGFTLDSSVVKTTYYLPTSVVVGIDYNISGNFYANATAITNVADRRATGNYYYNQFTLTPRYDTRVFSIGVPLTYGMQSQSFKAGIGARVAGFYVGTDDMLALFSNNQYGFNFYAGAFVPINFRKPKDDDHDKVSNKVDSCPGVIGEWAFKGCPNPDTDKDGVFDSADKCPTVFGSKTAMGCPDRDLDSVADAQDLCPDVAGPVALMGCPDKDKDGIADKDDECPDQPGLALYKGCPDTDGDNIPDNKDKCPTKAGALAFNGCPDTDGDGVGDDVDKCPTKVGPISNSGCPEIRVDVKKRLAFAATALEFETGKAKIKAKSYPLLDEIVGILNEYDNYYMTIHGHTDDVGSDVSNLQLSKERAASVKIYFVSKGINPDRLSTEGYGESVPVASNKTTAGRAKNRRVEMDLVLDPAKD